MHNTEVALSAFHRAGVPVDATPTSRGLVSIRAEDLVDGDRERTLGLLWTIARTLQLPALVQVATLRAELQRVLARGRRQPPAKVNGAAQHKAQQHVLLAVYMNDEQLSLLMEWVQAVCMQYGVTVHNFTTCFGDGRVLCLLVSSCYIPNVTVNKVKSSGDKSIVAFCAACHMTIPSNDADGCAVPAAFPVVPFCIVWWSTYSPTLHMSSPLESCSPFCVQMAYYLPNAIDVDSIYFPDTSGAAPTTQAQQATEDSDEDNDVTFGQSDMVIRPGGWSAVFEPGGSSDNTKADTHKHGVARNFAAFHRAAKSLGGVPAMLSSTDIAEHGPDERAVILYVAFLCSRLLEISKEDRAAHIIQRSWRARCASTVGECCTPSY